MEQYIADTGYREEIKQLAHNLSAKRPFYWDIIPTNSMLKGNIAWQHIMQENFSGDFVVRDESKNYLLFEYSPVSFIDFVYSVNKATK